MHIVQLLRDILAGYRPTEDEGIFLLKQKDRSIFAICSAADELREAVAGPVVTYVRNQNLNCTNICSNQCGFCGFHRMKGDADAFTLSGEEIFQRAEEAACRGVTEICSVSGLHPEFTLDSYLAIYSTIREAAPFVHLHAANPMEVAYAAEKSGCSTKEVLAAFREAGVRSLCGTAAEILSDPVRERICPEKISTEEWVRIIKEAHHMGIPTTATIMYGHCESDADRIGHLRILRDIQDETSGFTEFVPLSFVHANTRLYKNGGCRPGASGREDMLMTAVSRLFLDNFRNIQISWVKTGLKMVQLGLISGANDLGGTLYEESISREAGATYGTYLDPLEMEVITADIGRPLRERRTDYSLVIQPELPGQSEA